MKKHPLQCTSLRKGGPGKWQLAGLSVLGHLSIHLRPQTRATCFKCLCKVWGQRREGLREGLPLSGGGRNLKGR